MPFSNAAKATTILKVDPGAYWPEIALLFNGFLELFKIFCHPDFVKPLLNAFGSKLGVDTNANKSPL